MGQSLSISCSATLTVFGEVRLQNMPKRREREIMGNFLVIQAEKGRKYSSAIQVICMDK